MADALTEDLFKNSVTANDVSEYQGHGIVNYIMPWYLTMQYSFSLPSELPPDWQFPAPLAGYWTRDVVLRTTPRFEPYWGGAVRKAAAKIAAKSFEVKGNHVERYQRMLVEWGGDGYVPSQKRTVRDYLTTNNGAFVEIVRASNAPMARTLGLVHLDSLRVIRTNDPNTPYVFMDLKGQYHGLREDQVIALVDMPNTAQAAFGRGESAADTVYSQIYKLAVMDKYLTEKVTGVGANVVDFITGLTNEQMDSILTTAKQEAKARGQVYFQGHIISAILAKVDIQHVAINLRDIPDGFVRKEELEFAQLCYAVAIGLDPQDLNPALMGHGALGTGAQSVVLHEKQEGSTLATYEKEMTHQIDWKVLPSSMSFHLSESDLREQLQKAQVALAHAQTRQLQVANGEITGQEARQLAIEAEDMPADVQVETVADEDKPSSDEQAMNEQALAPVATPQPEPVPAVPMKQKEIDALIELKRSIDLARVELKAGRP